MHIWQVKTSRVLRITILFCMMNDILLWKEWQNPSRFTYYTFQLLNNFFCGFSSWTWASLFAGKQLIVDRLLFFCKHRRLACGLDCWWSWTSLFCINNKLWMLTLSLNNHIAGICCSSMKILCHMHVSPFLELLL